MYRHGVSCTPHNTASLWGGNSYHHPHFTEWNWGLETLSNLATLRTGKWLNQDLNSGSETQGGCTSGNFHAAQTAPHKHTLHWSPREDRGLASGCFLFSSPVSLSASGSKAWGLEWNRKHLSVSPQKEIFTPWIVGWLPVCDFKICKTLLLENNWLFKFNWQLKSPQTRMC